MLNVFSQVHWKVVTEQYEKQENFRENPDWFYCDQYSNEANWKAHYETTGPEIWEQSNGEVTHFVASLGTSGTFVGTSRYLKEISNGNIQC